MTFLCLARSMAANDNHRRRTDRSRSPADDIIRLSIDLGVGQYDRGTLRAGLMVAARTLEQRGHARAQTARLWNYIAAIG